ncbi:hypothetical protein D6825_03600 [Candidatus Woesearchaeota archaeon]|nr:MAG: hypothetical protein D6825_03600 [Candidatus Woesearchaeota archaeon]
MRVATEQGRRTYSIRRKEYLGTVTNKFYTKEDLKELDPKERKAILKNAGLSEEDLEKAPKTLKLPAQTELRDSNENVVLTYKRDTDGKLKYFDSSGKEVKNPDEAIRKACKKDRECFGQLNSELGSGILKTGPGFFAAIKDVYGFAGTVGLALRAYNQYSGLIALTNLAWGDWAANNRERLVQSFCLAAGIQNCLVSSICGQIHEITPNNVLAGRGPTGQYVSSAVINAERTQPVILEGVSRQQLIDIFGNQTVINGVLYDISNPNFDPSILGKLNLRLYHVQYSITNNAQEQRDLRWNIEFRRTRPEKRETTLPASLEEVENYPAWARTISTAYGEPYNSAKWFRPDETLEYADTTTDNIYKWSTNEWDTACLIFHPGLPSGGAAIGGLAKQLCVPITEYVGGPERIDQAIPARQSNAARQQASVASPPGQLV